MTIEEKVVHIQEVAMTEARGEGNQILDTHQKALESLYNKHALEAEKQMKTKIAAGGQLQGHRSNLNALLVSVKYF